MYRPWMGRTFGIEMEMKPVNAETGTFIPFRDLKAKIGATGVALNSRDHTWYSSNGQQWDIKTDGSVREAGRDGYEIASPAMYMDEDGECEEMKKVCDAIVSVNPKVDKACGLHVHVNCRDFTWRELQKLIALWVRYEPFFFEMLPRSRRSNTYCRPMRTAEWGAARTQSEHWPTVAEALRTDNETQFSSYQRSLGKYCSLNVSSFVYHGRVEFRLHSGTVSYEKIRNWVKMLLALVARVKLESAPNIAREVDPTCYSEKGYSTGYVFKMIGLLPSKAVPEVPETNRDLAKWVDRRREQFKRTKGGAR